MSRPLHESATSAAGMITPRRAADAPRAPAAANGDVRTLADLQRRVEPSSAVNPPAPNGGVHLGCRNLFKSYRKGAIGIPVLQGIDLDVHEGEFLAIVGQSGCGKSTLLHLLGTLDQPDAGEVHFEGHRIDNLPSASRDMLRNRHFGMIFQFYHLLPELTTLENILAPALDRRSRRSATGCAAAPIAGGRSNCWNWSASAIARSTSRANSPAAKCSGPPSPGRCLLKPKVLLADEPTGNLDRSTGEQVMQTLGELNRPGKAHYSHGDPRPLDRRAGRPDGEARRRPDCGRLTVNAAELDRSV